MSLPIASALATAMRRDLCRHQEFLFSYYPLNLAFINRLIICQFCVQMRKSRHMSHETLLKTPSKYIFSSWRWTISSPTHQPPYKNTTWTKMSRNFIPAASYTKQSFYNPPSAMLKFRILWFHSFKEKPSTIVYNKPHRVHAYRSTSV